jgi:hypothetical protein
VGQASSLSFTGKMPVPLEGYERPVLNGEENSLPFVDTVQIERSLIPLYGGASLFNEMYAFMGENGYTLVAIEHGFSDCSSGQLLQIDGIFHRF